MIPSYKQIPYGKTIHSLDASVEAAFVEQFLRERNNGTLDALSKSDFARGIKDYKKAIEERPNLLEYYEWCYSDED